MAPDLTSAPQSHAPTRVQARPASLQSPSTASASRTSSIMTYFNAVQFSSSLITRDKTLATIRADCITHIFYSSAKLLHDGTVLLGDQYLDAEMPIDNASGCLRACTLLREQNNSLKIVLSIGAGSVDGSESLSKVAASESARQRFALTAKGLVDAFGLNGVDVAWDHIQNEADAYNFILLLSDLRDNLQHRQYLLTTSMSFNTWVDFKLAVHYLDFINLKCFDFAAPNWSDSVSHASQVYSPRTSHKNGSMSCYTAIAHMRAGGVPASKIMLGIPAFGRGYLGASSLGEDYSKKKGSSRTFPVSDLPQAGTHYDFDDEVKACYSSGGDGGWISFDSPWSVQFKAELVKENGLAGLITWEALGDHRDHSRSIVAAGYQYLLPEGVQ